MPFIVLNLLPFLLLFPRAVVLTEGMSHSSLPRVGKKEPSSSDGPDAESQQKTGMPFDLLSPMREEKSLLAIKAVSTSRWLDDSKRDG